MNTGMKIVAYPKRREVTIVAYVPTLAGVKPVSVRVTLTQFKQIMEGAKRARARGVAVVARVDSVGAALILMKIPDAAKIIPYWFTDRVFKAAWKKSAKIRTEIWSRALDKVRGDAETARSYIRVWLRAKNREVPADDKDAAKVAEQYWSLVWKFGASRYVVQVAPWE
jgi:hypothetical protein